MDRVLPAPTELTSAYWDAARSGELVLQHCRSCERFVHFPESACPYCGGDELDWKAAPRRGTVHTFSVIHRTFAPGYGERTPYVIAWVELEGCLGVRLFGNVTGIDPDDVRCGQLVEVIFEDLEGFGPIPNFRASVGARSEED